MSLTSGAATTSLLSNFEFPKPCARCQRAQRLFCRRLGGGRVVPGQGCSCVANTGAIVSCVVRSSLQPSQPDASLARQTFPVHGFIVNSREPTCVCLTVDKYVLRVLPESLGHPRESSNQLRRNWCVCKQQSRWTRCCATATSSVSPHTKTCERSLWRKRPQTTPPGHHDGERDAQKLQVVIVWAEHCHDELCQGEDLTVPHGRDELQSRVCAHVLVQHIALGSAHVQSIKKTNLFHATPHRVVALSLRALYHPSWRPEPKPVCRQTTDISLQINHVIDCRLSTLIPSSVKK